MPSLGWYCDHTLQRIWTQIYRDSDALIALRLTLLYRNSRRCGPSNLRNQQRRCSFRHHAGLESRLQNQAAITEWPPQHPAKEPDEYSDAKSPSSPASPSVVCWGTLCSLYQLSYCRRRRTGVEVEDLKVEDFEVEVVLQNTWSTRGVRKQESLPCCRGTFHSPTLLATTMPKTISSTFGMFTAAEAWASKHWQSWEREEETASERSSSLKIYWTH